MFMFGLDIPLGELNIILNITQAVLVILLIRRLYKDIPESSSKIGRKTVNKGTAIKKKRKA